MKTALYEAHHTLGAKMVEFAGWMMPLYYQGIIPEHLAVREKVGLFDVSHMGRILVEGKDAESLLDYLSTNRIQGKPSLSATYTVWSRANGGSVDDLIVYKRDPLHFFVIVNASNREKDLAHLQEQSKEFAVTITPRYTEEAILSLQGPNAVPLLCSLFPAAQSLKPMQFCDQSYRDQGIMISCTGYTGAGGYEIYGPQQLLVTLWQELLDTGKPFGITPAGLGARDTLRLEMGYALYGHEISEEIAATESVAAWAVKWEKERFLGRESLKALEDSGKKRSEYGIVLLDQGIARADYLVKKQGRTIGRVTSGTYSPTLKQAIALILVDVPLKEGDLIQVEIREHLCNAKVVKLPFLRG